MVEQRTFKCRMAGCDQFGKPNFTCSKCDQRNTYFCPGDQRRLMSELKILGKATIACESCASVIREQG
jgi:hypothetical protein